jgi:histone H3/H4
MARPTSTPKQITTTPVKHESAADETVVQKRTRRTKSGTRALREIRKAQKSTDRLLNKSACSRLFRDIAAQIKTGVRFQEDAIRVLHEATEAYGVKIMQQGMHCTANRKSQTLCATDIRTALAIGSGW